MPPVILALVLLTAPRRGGTQAAKEASVGLGRIVAFALPLIHFIP